MDKLEELKAKRAKPTLSIAAKTVHFLQRSVVRGKVVKVDYFEEQGLQVFLQAQAWLDLFANNQMGCSVPDLAEFCANCEVTSSVVTGVVNGKCIKLNATSFGEILRILTKGFSMHVWEDKTMLVAVRLLDLAS